jgi:hypothetical protein
MTRAVWCSPKNQLRISEVLLKEPEIPMCEVVTIPCPKAFDTKKIVFGTNMND